jgi:ureidoacrylate peracid hydrolase
VFKPAREVLCNNGVISIRPDSQGPRPPGSGSPLLMVPERSAVIVVDVQRAFTELPPFAAMREIVPSIARFLPFARVAGMMVVHLRTEFSHKMENAGRPGSRTRQMMLGLGSEDENPLLQDRPTAEIVPELSPHPDDVIVTKTRFSGFWGTNLHEALRSRNIESLIFAGGTTTVCVESTLRDAMFLEFNSLVLSDCTADITRELHESALLRMELFFGWVCRSEDLIPLLELEPARKEGMEAPAR